ncbi:MAG: YkgJ family cysteine cluster protein [Verrucomicrobia bacterium]|nr:YkgJ family cysteine cluster protein [Verrucomicrobiota bacterium]MBS0636668.1 YkgJ family cysteine cluster protein [Verrucomicrobiota bacterium]
MTSQDPALPWYKEGLRFKCTECGKCCTGAPGFVWITQEEMEAMARHLAISVDLFKRRYVRIRNNRLCLVEKKSENNACIFLEGKRCQIYQVRPKQCRTFPWWKENLHSEESWNVAARDCEGINDEAPIVPLSQITEQLEKSHT